MGGVENSIFFGKFRDTRKNIVGIRMLGFS